MESYEAPFLSIIVPFHNSEEVCHPLLDSLARLRAEDQAELIFVDDGSSDNTTEVLRQFASSSAVPVYIIERGNGGPGAARNSGLDRASGQFIWFVDSDDAIEPSVIAHAKAADWTGVDLIAWEYAHPWIRRPLAPGLHARSYAPAPPDVFDPIVANWFSMAFLERTRMRFPEYCIYEATPLEAFALPLLVSTYYKSEFKAYRCILDNPSVTRGETSNPRHYDRLFTISLGRAFAEKLELSSDSKRSFDAAFVRLFLWYSIKLSKSPGPSWLLAARVMRQFRDEALKFNISDDPFDHYSGGRASALILRLLWILSAVLPKQDAFFSRLRMRTWGRDVEWSEPTLPLGAR